MLAEDVIACIILLCLTDFSEVFLDKYRRTRFSEESIALPPFIVSASSSLTRHFSAIICVAILVTFHGISFTFY